ncbi:hypothetical protein [Streptomyces sp. NPDC003077]|uniref:hypothetical protein n=1 Tax=Streptomyces sp. NPDC003077 TaxID=3154443 RepID=UPI0033A0ED83
MFLTDSLGAAAATGLPPAHRYTPTGPPSTVGTDHLRELRAGLRSLYHLDDAYGGDDVRPLALRHLRRVRRVINGSAYPPTIGRQLHLLAGETAEHCGWLYFDADDQGTARRYWGEALTAATMLRDDSLELLVLASLSMQASHEGRPRDGYELARAAQERARKYGSPTIQSLLAVREARALSLMRDEAGARKRLTNAMHLADRACQGRPCPGWAAFHGRTELDYAQGLLYTETGHHQAAVTFMRAALAHQDRTYGRNRALYRLTLARTLVRAGEAEEGAAYAVDSLEHLAEVESGRVTKRLNEVTALLRTQDTTAARDAAEELTSYTHHQGI